MLPLLSCRQEQETGAPADLTLRVAHLHDYAWQDRNQSGQPVDMKPASERQALLRELNHPSDDLLVLRGLGSAASLRHLQSSLKESGRELPHLHYIPGKDDYQGIGFLSNRPFSETRKLNAETFRIKEKNYHPLAGGILLSTRTFPALWVWNQQAPPPEEPYERRRNDARIMAQTLRPLIQSGAEVLLTLHSREEMDSPMIRIWEDLGLQRVLLEDRRGDSWTYRDPQGILYRQDQWIFATPKIYKKLIGAEVFDSEDLRQAGPYRHQGIQLP
ncbi:hypothetical protein P0Y35_09315 [Kiritimatiellaeota bacterium B1221]|nr:hypothetical protein [Kiritimatiellaeota bacterium B1221]